MILNLHDETSQLQAVVLGQPGSMGAMPSLEQTYDAKSYESVEKGIYPTEEEITYEMDAFEDVLLKHKVQVFRPWVLQNCNQVFARDVGFVIGDTMVISNLIETRVDEQEAYEQIIRSIAKQNVLHLPEEAHVEGGDVILYNDFLFVGLYKGKDYPDFKTARTNAKAVEFLKYHFPNKWVIDFELVKHDTNPYEGILHLDCTFQPVGKNKAIVYKEGFKNERGYKFLLDIFGKSNIFEVTKEEMYWMAPNVFSISEDVVVSEQNFTRLNQHMREEWGIKVEEIPYRNVSKMGGLLRCSTMPLIREN